jgi:hypothetical protein
MYEMDLTCPERRVRSACEQKMNMSSQCLFRILQSSLRARVVLAICYPLPIRGPAFFLHLQGGVLENRERIARSKRYDRARRGRACRPSRRPPRAGEGGLLFTCIFRSRAGRPGEPSPRPSPASGRGGAPVLHLYFQVDPRGSWRHRRRAPVLRLYFRGATQRSPAVPISSPPSPFHPVLRRSFQESSPAPGGLPMTFASP